MAFLFSINVMNIHELAIYSSVFIPIVILCVCMCGFTRHTAIDVKAMGHLDETFNLRVTVACLKEPLLLNMRPRVTVACDKKPSVPCHGAVG